jgi:PAS domain S-box-containing protein
VFSRTRKRCVHELGFEALADRAPDIMIRFDRQLRHLYINPAVTASTGYPPEHYIGRTNRELGVEPELCALWEREFEELFRDGRPRRFEFELDGPLGRRSFEAHAVPERRADGGFDTIISFTRDRTEARQAERARQESDERYRELFQLAMDMTFLFDGDGRCVDANPAALAAFGYERDELIGLSFEQLVATEHLDGARARVDAQLDGSPPEQIYESAVVRKDGSTFPIEATMQALRRNGQLESLLVIARDTSARSERRRLEEALRESQRLEAIGRLAGGVAHDFNNLLLAIHGYGELALGRLGPEERPAEDVRQMLAAARRAADLTRQLLAFGRRQVLNVEVVDLRVVVRGMAQLLRPLVGEQIELAIEAPDEPVRVTADRAQLEQVLANLAVNARDAMPAGGRLSIDVSATGTHARLAVRDTGEGMDEATAERIFEPFFTTKGEAGTGLGLATVHGVVTQSGGTIEVESRPGAGTAFTIALPLSERALTPALPFVPAAPDGAETVLLVDDEREVRDVVAEMLTRRGYAVVAACDGQEAVHVAADAERTVDLVLSDLVMRGLTGRETAERIRTLHPEAKVLYMSGYSDDQDAVASAVQPGTGFIQKPFSGDDLARQVRELLDA